MNLLALLVTYMFFFHPGLLAIIAIILAIFLLATAFPLGVALVALIIVGYIAYNLFVG